MLKKSLSVVLSVLMMLGAMSCAFAAEGDAPSSFGYYKHVFIIGVDGAGAAFDKVDSPNFDRIFGSNAYRHDAVTEDITVSAQNWGSILTGVTYDTHGFTNDSTGKNKRQAGCENPSIFYYARQKFPDAKLVSFNNWSNINHGIIEYGLGVNKINRKSDPLLTQSIVRYFESGNKPDLMFVQLDSVDHAAHSHGGFSDEYYDAVKKMDGYLGQIYDAIAGAGLMDDGLFILVADHGETTNGHGGNTPEEMAAVLSVAGKTVNQTILPETAHNRDVSAIALYALGIEQPAQMVSSVPEGLFGAEKDKVADLGSEELPVADKLGNFFLKMLDAFVSLFDWIASV